MSDTKIDYNALTPEERLAVITYVCQVSKLTDAHINYYMASSMTVPEIMAELTHLRGYRDLRTETVSSRRAR